MNNDPKDSATGTVRHNLRIVIPPNVLGAVVIDFIEDGREFRYLVKAPDHCTVRVGDRGRLRVILEDV
jgi:hypothetical protein